VSTRAVTAGHRASACSRQAYATVTTDTKIAHSPEKVTSTIDPRHINWPFGAVSAVISGPTKLRFMVQMRFSVVKTRGFDEI